jgi:hypothetical protein
VEAAVRWSCGDGQQLLSLELRGWLDAKVRALAVFAVQPQGKECQGVHSSVQKNRTPGAVGTEAGSICKPREGRAPS